MEKYTSYNCVRWNGQINVCYISDYVAGGELFSHLYRRDRFTPNEVRVYVAEIIIALEKLHQVSFWYLSIDTKSGS